MPLPNPTAQDEEEFMRSLLGNDAFWNAVPSPNVTPVKRPPLKAPPSKRAPTVTPTKQRPGTAATTQGSSSVAVPSPAEVDIAALLEGAEDWDWTDMNSDFTSPKKAPVTKPSQTQTSVTPQYIRQTCTRCVVKSIEQVHGGKFQKNLTVEVEQDGERRSVILEDDWTATDIRIGDTINVLGSFTSNSITINLKANFVIHHPDLLITATALSNALQCRRKPLLSALVRSTSDISPALVWGNMLHEVMQSCLSSGHWEESWVQNKIDSVVRDGLMELVKLNVTVEDAKREVKFRAKGLQAFAQKYISAAPKTDAILTNTRSTHNQTSHLAISKLLDVEEDIWSPTYGLKGKIDATVLAAISDPNPPFRLPAIITGPRPFEIKTGRAIAGLEHRAQTMLYTILTEERYGVECPSGLLFYTQSEEVVRVPASRNEIRGLIIARNEMAGYMMKRMRSSVEERFLPPTIDDERMCKRCFVLDTCMLYRKAVENVEDATSPIADAYELKAGHLTLTQGMFFKKWEALLALEEQDIMRFKKELWTMGASEREAKGRCFSSMILDVSFCPPPIASSSKDAKIHQFTYRFVRVPGCSAGTSLLNGHLNSGDPVTVSVEPSLLALARGYILDLQPLEVTVGVDHELSTDNIQERLHALKRSSPVSTPELGSHVVFRIDKDELFGGMGRMRDNVAQLFYADGDTKRLELVVDLKPPTFDSDHVVADESISRFSAYMNANQQQAMNKVLAAQDYALILGMPGTGKTTVISAVIQTLVALGKTVLLTSYTHSAVDTILLKLKDHADFGILRLGNIDRVHPDIQEFTLSARRKAATVEELEHQLMSPPVVATTCLSVDHVLFTRRKFDYCIVDEASQITLPTCLGPLRYADKFVLVGDHFQLPPLVRNPNARKGGLDVSLFRRLSDAHPNAVVDLAYQYRMNEDIMALSNKLIYGDRLRCGSETVAKRSLVLPDRTFLRAMHRGNQCHSQGCWIEKLMSESCKAVFVDTDNAPARDSRVGELVQNEVEANLVFQTTQTLLRSGVRANQIGIISLYRQQVKLIANLLQGHKDIEILTADRSQGRDKDCIIISMVRSNDGGQIGELVKDWRRMNVSFTRARSKLIIFGSRKTLRTTPLLEQFFLLMDNRNWILQLPAHADQLHSDFRSSSHKRVPEPDDPTLAKENKERPLKKLKLKKPQNEEGILRGRPILRDLVNGDK